MFFFFLQKQKHNLKQKICRHPGIQRPCFCFYPKKGENKKTKQKKYLTRRRLKVLTIFWTRTIRSKRKETKQIRKKDNIVQESNTVQQQIQRLCGPTIYNMNPTFGARQNGQHTVHPTHHQTTHHTPHHTLETQHEPRANTAVHSAKQTDGPPSRIQHSESTAE